MLFRSDRKSTRLNSSHTIISYAVFCLKKKKSRQVTSASAHAFPPPPDSATSFRRRSGQRRLSVCHLSPHIRCLVRFVLIVVFSIRGDPPSSPLFPSRPPSQ